MSIKQVIVIRTRYPDGKGGFFKPRTGKLVAQGAHASMKVFFDRATIGYTWQVGINDAQEFAPNDDPTNAGNFAMLIHLNEAMRDWAEGLFTKVCVQVESEEALLAVAAQAQTAGLPCAIIQDAGLTEFGGVPTYTCCALGPAPSDTIDLITGALKLL